MRLVSKSAAALMPAGSRQVLLAPTHTCTSLPDHVLLTSAKPKRPINYVTCFHVKGRFSLMILYPYILWFNLVCLAEVLFCLRFWIYFFFFVLFHPPEVCVGRWAVALGCTVQHLTGGVSICLFESGHSRWFEGRSGWFETSSAAAVNKWSCQSRLFEVLTVLSANNPGTLGWGLFDVETFGKRSVKRDIVCSMLLIRRTLGRLRWTLAASLGHSRCHSWLSWSNTSMNNSLLFRIFLMYSCAK